MSSFPRLAVWNLIPNTRPVDSMQTQNLNSCRRCWLRSTPRAVTRAHGRVTRLRVVGENCLIVNTNSGAHAFIGLHLAQALLKKNHKVTILNNGDQAKVSKKAPFSQYGSLESQGVAVQWGDPADSSAIPQGDFDVVYDNSGKTLEACKPLIDNFKGKVQHYVFVASAGAYVPDGLHAGHVEGDKRKSSAGHVAVENYLKEEGLPFTVFQPHYIYGPHTAKDCEQWFLDRVLRDRSVPVPAPGLQLASISHVDDIADMLAKVPGNKKAIGQHYTLCSDRVLTFDGIVKICAEAAGKTPEIVHYDPSSAPKGAFPFRMMHFFSQPDKAKHDLGWKPQHTFPEDVKDLIKAFEDSGRLQKEPDFSVDDQLLASSH